MYKMEDDEKNTAAAPMIVWRKFVGPTPCAKNGGVSFSEEARVSTPTMSSRMEYDDTSLKLEPRPSAPAEGETAPAKCNSEASSEPTAKTVTPTFGPPGNERPARKDVVPKVNVAHPNNKRFPNPVSRYALPAV